MSDVRNEHPLAVRVSVGLSDGTNVSDKPTGCPSDSFGRRVDYVLLPEFKAPAAVAASPGEGQDEQALKWSKDDSESLHPFWALRRIPSSKLEAIMYALGWGLGPEGWGFGGLGASSDGSWLHFGAHWEPAWLKSVCNLLLWISCLSWDLLRPSWMHVGATGSPQKDIQRALRSS